MATTGASDNEIDDGRSFPRACTAKVGRTGELTVNKTGGRWPPQVAQATVAGIKASSQQPATRTSRRSRRRDDGRTPPTDAPANAGTRINTGAAASKVRRRAGFKQEIGSKIWFMAKAPSLVSFGETGRR